jgi:ectoine hydroxylase-related dioxygenase (phytanoyl-CoA dioxygenase family)
MNLIRELIDVGYVILPGAISARRVAEISLAYDELMVPSSSPDFKAGSTTNRRYFVDSRMAFQGIYQCPPLLVACAQLIGQPFQLSSLLGRTLRAGSPAQKLHTDIARDSADAPMAGFILMLDPFTRASGATRFIPGSQTWPDVPFNRLADPCLDCEGEVLACGDAGSMIIFNPAVWHGHTANTTPNARRSIQGYFVRCGADEAMHLPGWEVSYATTSDVFPVARRPTSLAQLPGCRRCNREDYFWGRDYVLNSGNPSSA